MIVFDVPGVRDVVVDGKTGFVVAQDDLDGLVAATGRIVEKPLLIETMGHAARDTASSTSTSQPSAPAGEP